LKNRQTELVIAAKTGEPDEVTTCQQMIDERPNLGFSSTV